MKNDRIGSRFQHFRLTFIFSLIVFGIMFTSITIVSGILYVLYRNDIISNKNVTGVGQLIFLFICVLVGGVIAAFVSKRPLEPIRQLVSATNKIAEGDYSARIDLKGLADLNNLSNSFNHMAEELASVEVLRNDFVNNFSHEFKTPIVSIRGFARMLKREDLSKEERDEYINIIIGESERLADLSTNVLNLSKIEQQKILTDRTRYNLSEQIRTVIAMLDTKWYSKNISYNFYASEVMIDGNEELLKQVWINLIDNAIKFSAEGESVDIGITNRGNLIEITVHNSGDVIGKDAIAHIFDKFYQGDTSHTVNGNGLGLAIVYRIIDLHGGNIMVESGKSDGTKFTVSIPQKTFV